jgi:hypothetical protein
LIFAIQVILLMPPPTSLVSAPSRFRRINN